MKEFTPHHRPALVSALVRLDRVHVMAVAFSIGLAAFLAIEPTQNWLLLLLTVLAALAADAIIRHHPKGRFKHLDDTALYLFVPVLFVLAAGLFLEEVVQGYWTAPVGLLMGVPFGFALQAEYNCVQGEDDTYHTARLILNVATYITAFLFYATIYDFELTLVTTVFAVSVVSVLLGIEVLREEAMETPRTLLYAGAIGLLMADVAWALHFLPLQETVAAIFLLLAFYLLTGLMHSYLGQHLNLRTAGEFVAMGTLGLAIVIVSHNVV